MNTYEILDIAAAMEDGQISPEEGRQRLLEGLGVGGGVFEWEESDDKYAKYESTNEVSLSDIIYGFDCFECGEEVWNTDFDPDPDSPVWSYECHECSLRYSVRPTKVQATAADSDL